MDTVSFESAMVSAIGQFGLSQLIIVTAVKLSKMIVAWALLMTILIGAEPDWWRQSTLQASKTSNTTIVNNMTSTIWLYKVPPSDWTNSSDVIKFNSTRETIVSEWNLIGTKSWIPATIMTVQMIGLLFGGSLIGQLSDWFGRRKSLIGSYVLVLVTVLAHGFSSSWQMMTAFAFFLGVGLGGYLVSCDIFVLEFVGTNWRTFVTCIVPPWPLGVMMLGGASTFLPKWRHLCYANVIAGLPALILFLFCPESVRWLLTQGRLKEAQTTVEILAAGNRLPPPPVETFADLIQQNKKPSQNKKVQYNYLTLFSNSFARWRVLVFGFIWFSIAFGYYAISFGISTLDGDISLNTVYMGLVEIGGVWVVVIGSRLAGRKWLTFFFLLGTSLSLLGVTVAIHIASWKSISILKAVLSLLAKFCNSAVWPSIILFAVETFPTVIRNAAFGMICIFGRVGAILAPQNLHLVKLSTHVPYTVNGLMHFVSALLCLLLKDTYSSHMQDDFGEEKEDLRDNAIEMAPAWKMSNKDDNKQLL